MSAVREPGHALKDRQRFDRLSNLVHLDRFFGIDVRNPCAPIGRKHDQAFILQLLQRFSHGNAARAEMRREKFLPDPRAGTHLAAQNGATNFTRDLFAKQAAILGA